jgi:hypothetical protein
MQKKDYVAIALSILALFLSIFNTSWQYREYLDKQFQFDYMLSNVGDILLRGDIWDWKVNFTVTLKMATPHNLKISIVTPEDYFYVDNRIYNMLVQGYPISIQISHNVDEYAGEGVNSIQLQVPVEAKFLIGGQYQAQYTLLQIGKLHFFVHLRDLTTNDTRTLETDSYITWMKD